MIGYHDKIKDVCITFETCINDIALKLQELPTEDYKLVERYTDLDKELNYVFEWYNNKRSEITNFINRYNFEKLAIDIKLLRMESTLKLLDEDVNILIS